MISRHSSIAKHFPGAPGVATLRAAAPQVASALIAALVIADAAHFVWRWRAQTAPAGAMAAAGRAWPRGDRQDPAASLARIKRLFGGEPSAPADVAPGPTRFTLAGTLALQDPHRGAAILADGAQHEQLYVAGARLADGSLLDQVYADRVVLERGGAEETLRLPHTPSRAQGGGMRVRVASRGAAATGESGEPEPPRVIHPVELSAAQQWFRGLWARPANDEQGHVVGLTMHPNLRMQAHYGLHSEDVVTAINGVPIDGSVDVEALLAQSSSPSLALTVTHDGAARTLTVPVN
jgi:type II secretory pathway component PulC